MIGRYELLEFLGEDEYGERYLAQTTGLGLQTALEIRTIVDGASFDQADLDHCRAAVHLNHPNIIQLFEVGVVDTTESGRLYFLGYRYIDGFTLRDLLHAVGQRHQVLPTDIALLIIQELSRALGYLHTFDVGGVPALRDCCGAGPLSYGTINGDNIILSRGGNVQLHWSCVVQPAPRKTRAVAPPATASSAAAAEGDLVQLFTLLGELLLGLGTPGHRALRRAREVIGRGPTEIDAACLGDLLEMRLSSTAALREQLGGMVGRACRATDLTALARDDTPQTAWIRAAMALAEQGLEISEPLVRRLDLLLDQALRHEGAAKLSVTRDLIDVLLGLAPAPELVPRHKVEELEKQLKALSPGTRQLPELIELGAWMATRGAHR